MKSDSIPQDVRYTRVKPSPPQSEKQERHAVAAKQSWLRHHSSWRTPAIMIGSLVVAVAFALGHHFFYRYCNGKEADQHLPQQWVTRAGTAFAFVVKMFLAIPTGVAYVQYCWLSLQSRPQNVQRVDAMLSVLGNALQFIDVGLWLRNPLLAFPAVITWLLPIAAIITPGTITVNSTRQTPEFVGLVPQLEYNYSQYVTVVNDDNYVGPSNILSRLAISSAMQGEILPIVAPEANASYSLDFMGPAISCRPQNSTLLVNYTLEGVRAGDPVSFLSWVPSELYNFNLTNPPDSGVNGMNVTNTLDYASSDHARIYVLILLSDTTDYTFLTCSLMNATYSVSFDFRYPVQTIRLTSPPRHVNGVPATDSISIYENDFMAGSAPASYQAIMDAFGRIMVGSTVSSHYGGESSYTTLFPATALGDLASQPGKIGPKELGPALEELFQNMTLSLLSSTSFQKNATQALPVTITSEQYRNLYVYSASDLWLAYGLSIFFALCCVTVGMGAILRTGYAYSNDFSTVLRTTRGHDLDALVAPAETKGGLPLPNYIAMQTIVFDNGDSNTNADGVGVGGFRVIGTGPDKKSAAASIGQVDETHEFGAAL